jgi:hypothetical protein
MTFAQCRLIWLAAAIASSTATAQDRGPVRPLAPARGVAELPRLLPPLPRELASRPCTRRVGPSASVQAALDRAKGGDVICLAEGARYAEDLVLPARPDTDWVVVRTAPGAEGAASANGRIRPSMSAMLAKVVAQSNARSAIRTAPGARRWYLLLLEVTTDSTAPVGPTALITLGGGGAAEGERPAMPAVASELVLDRVFAHGWPDQTLRRCLALNSGATVVIDSWLDECHEKGSDSQAIGGWGGTGPYLIENNTLRGAGENVMFGGADPRTFGLTPSDVVLRRNHIASPPEWIGRWTKKNLVETKNVRRMLIEENVLEGSWTDGQDGWAIVLKSANQSGRCTWCITADVVVRRNLIRNVGAGIAVNGRGGDRGNIDSVSRRIEITQNYVEDVAVMPYRGVGRLMQVLTGVDGLLIAENTLLAPPSADLRASLVLGSPRIESARGLVFERNLLTRGRYAVSGCGGPRAMSACLPGARIAGNVLVGTPRPEDRLLAGFAVVGSVRGAGRAGVDRALVERAVAGVVVPR